ncbi:hypothetical protein Hanom_Chr04g00336161 [Helianthus anomalus]
MARLKRVCSTDVRFLKPVKQMVSSQYTMHVLGQNFVLVWYVLLFRRGRGATCCSSTRNRLCLYSLFWNKKITIFGR